VTVALALLASALFGSGVALQQRPARNVPDAYAARLGLLSRLARRPLWLAGVGAEIAGFALQVVALRHGSLVVVQPVITTSLVFTIAIAATWSSSEVGRRDWIAVVAVVAGLSLFMITALPSDRSSGTASRGDWEVFALFMAGAIAVLLALGLRSANRRRAALLGLTAGLADAVMAVLTKAFAHDLSHGWLHVVRSWSPYALCAVGIVALLLSQTAYQTGRPTVSLPIITVTDPIISSAVGVGLFDEAIKLSGLRPLGVIASAAFMLAGLVYLSRSTVVIDRSVDHEVVCTT
jgi:drug/metabolite transporter (DMT)-like permease